MIRQIEAPPTVAPTVAQQIFIIGSGIAGGLAGFGLARDFAKVEKVDTRIVVGTTIISIIFTLGAGLYLGRKVRGY